MKTYQRMLAALLCLLLLCGQQAAIAHAVVHYAESGGSTQEQQTPHEQACGLCIVLAQSGAAPTSIFTLSLRQDVHYSPPFFVPMQAALPSPLCVFHPRAPPVS